MACYKPLDAWQGTDGSIRFGREPKNARPLQLPCGRCIGCRTARQREWATRIAHEATLHRNNSFITLTYDEEHYKPTLNYHDYQLFMRYLRRKMGKCRFFAAGEYGEQYNRPHWHAILFGITFTDGTVISDREGAKLYTSQTLDKIWGKGMTTFGEVNQQTANYVAGYCVKKITGQKAKQHYERIDAETGEIIKLRPELGVMSKGIGKGWFDKYWKEVYVPRDGVVLPGGRTIPAPRYYDKQMQEKDGLAWDQISYQRYLRSLEYQHDQTPQRLKAKELCATARYNQRRKQL